MSNIERYFFSFPSLATSVDVVLTEAQFIKFDAAGMTAIEDALPTDSDSIVKFRKTANLGC